MNFALWVIAGGVLGWASYAIFQANKPRGVKVSIIIGAVGALIGGHFLPPLLGVTTMTSHDFSLYSLVAALASAAACLAIADVISNPFGQ